MNAQMKFQTPNHTQLKTIVEEFGMHMSDKTIQEFLDAMQDLIQEYAVVDSMSDYLPSIDYARSQVFFPKEAGRILITLGMLRLKFVVRRTDRF